LKKGCQETKIATFCNRKGEALATHSPSMAEIKKEQEKVKKRKTCPKKTKSGSKKPLGSVVSDWGDREGTRNFERRKRKKFGGKDQ